MKKAPTTKLVLQLCLVLVNILVTNSKEFLLILVNEEVAALQVASGNAGPHQVFHFSEQLSSACSQHNRAGRCRNLTLLHHSGNGNQTNYLVFAPLQTKIGMKELQYNGTMFEVVQSSEMELTVNNCTILDIMNIGNQIIAPCITSNVLYSCSVQLYSSSTEVNCREILTFTRHYTKMDHPFITNFVWSSDYREHLFAIRGEVYGINFGHFNFFPRGNLRNSNCNHLEYIGNFVTLAYCGSRQAIKFSDEHFLSYSLNDTGIPFVCPMSGWNVTVREVQGTTSLRYNSLNLHTNITNFVYGECHSGLFFLVDDPTGVTVFDITSANPQPPVLPDSSRTTSLVLFEGPYAVALKQNSVVLYNTSFQPVVRWTGGGAAMVGVLSGLTEAEPPTDSESTTPQPPLSDTTHRPRRFATEHIIAVGIVVAIFIIIAVVAAISIPICTVYICRCHKKCKSTSICVQAASGPTNTCEPVFGYKKETTNTGQSPPHDDLTQTNVF